MNTLKGGGSKQYFHDLFTLFSRIPDIDENDSSSLLDSVIDRRSVASNGCRMPTSCARGQRRAALLCYSLN